MLFLRRALALISLGGAVWLAVILKTDGWRLSEFEIGFATIAALLLAANFLYMMQAPTHAPRTRLGRMWRLWWDAKEAELASRARSQSSERTAAAPDKS